MRVLHVTDAREFSGGVKQLKLLMEGFRSRGFQQVLAAPPGGRVADSFEQAGFQVRRVKMFQDYDLGAAWRLRGIIREFRPDLVHAHHPKAHALVLIARVFSRFRFIASRRVTHPVKPYPTSRWKYGSSLIDRFVAVSGAVKEELIKAGVKPEKIAVIGSSTDMSRFHPGAPSAAVMRDLGISAGSPPVIGVVANYSPWKGQDLFLEALGILKKRFGEKAPALFYIAGRDTDGPQIRESAARYGVSGWVKFLGWREDVPEILKASACLVCPSLSGEGSSGSIREAFAAEIAVIASDIAANRELAGDQRGWLFESGSAVSLAGALEAFLSCPVEERRLKISRASAFVREHFSAESMVKKTFDLYSELMKAS